ncbi:energy transducer TonB [Capnocytophaga stomatis]|uniref:Energy transducer TonB n=1 Tax=Capnocytophaga stomatis TaxID=1848904 RepID=A0ABW8QBM9_9FLAO
MQPKKSPKADLTKNSGLFFAIGFALVSALSYAGFELKSYDRQVFDDRKTDVDKLLDEEQEEIVLENVTPPPPPPPPPAVVQEVEIVENEKEIEETIIQDTEVKKDEVIEVSQIQEVVEEPEEVDVPFTIIEDKPMFESCKDVPKDKQFDCFKQNLDKHVHKNFSYPQAAAEMGIQGRVNVHFRINKDGSITIIGVRGPDKMLEAEARRIIEKLPKLIPGKQRGKPTSVTFSYPINFKLNS